MRYEKPDFKVEEIYFDKNIANLKNWMEVEDEELSESGLSSFELFSL